MNFKLTEEQELIRKTAREFADVELAAKTSVEGRIYNNGETCVAAKRFVVVDAVYDKFKEAFANLNRIVPHYRKGSRLPYWHDRLPKSFRCYAHGCQVDPP